jgi:ABC-2 type transport system permease protein
MDALFRILNLTWKELLTVLKDPRSRFNLVGPPLFQVLIFGYAATYDLNSVPYALVDQDRSAASAQFVAHFDGSGAFRRVADLPNEAMGVGLVERREVLMLLQFPPDFEARLLRGERPEVQVIVDGRNSNTAGTAINYATAILGRFNADWGVAHGGTSSAAGVRVVERAWFNPNLDTRWFMVPGMIVMLTLLDVMLLTSLSVAREREQGTLDQLLVTPMRPLELLAGKAIPSILIGLVQTSVVLAAALFWFRIPFAGSYLTLFTAVMLFLAAAVGVGLLVSALCATMQQAMLGSFVVLMPFALLSGLTTPLTAMPAWVQAITLVNPLRWGTQVVHRVFLEGASFWQVWPLLIPMVLIAVPSFLAAAWVFRHRLA